MNHDPYGTSVLTTKNKLKDGRSMKRTGRTEQSNTKFTWEELSRMKSEAELRGLALNAMIVQALELLYVTHPVGS